ncbi:MAG: hypothetical protein LBD55_03665 [Treponema sp.]|nr:hypothetical protein [Treponema sp.]
MVSEESKKELKRRKGLYNPPLLNEGLGRAVAAFLRLRRGKVYTTDGCREPAAESVAV